MSKLLIPTIVGCASIVPFVALELVNRRGYGEGFPVPLFVFLWILAAAFTVVASPILRSVWAGQQILARPAGLLSRLALLGFIGWMWGAIVIDQLPCFLGVPNCD